MEKRKVAVYEWRRVEGQSHLEKVHVGNGFFHQFGVDYEEFEGCIGNYTTAVVEMLDGTIKNVQVELVTFSRPRIQPQ